ncbi:peptidoglycan-binding domain-containing protein [Yinghuangia soli]|uniref:Peptidoglycan-binding protein n=1 Tax=Yinghuangia soli TaxID=2908204 RepID=A0AA41TZX8_9ACTN|nr:peptidoglycan-binding domain-containing protein [Yinghuangia soli]MCF2527775.1 peptidoglycan-binding protein [Yinghuangia soli]
MKSTTIRRSTTSVLSAAAIVVGVLAGTAQANNVGNIGVGSGNTAGVKCIQKSYNYIANRGLAVDGIYGNATKQATIDFQRLFKLGVDGIVGKQTGDTLWWAVNYKAGWGLYENWGCQSKVPNSR